MYRYLFSINKKNTKECLAYAELNIKNEDLIYPSLQHFKRIEELTGIEIDGINNWIEWVRIG